jgi:two-component system LytT family response regulator
MPRTNLAPRWVDENIRSYADRILIREPGRAYFVPVRDIDWIKVERNYLLIHCDVNVHTLRGTLDALQAALDPQCFFRANRSSIVALDAVRELIPWLHGEYRIVLKCGTEARWSRRYVGRRLDLLNR